MCLCVCVCVCVFQQIARIRSFNDTICASKIDIDEAEMDQSNLLDNMAEFNNKSRLKNKERKVREN